MTRIAPVVDLFAGAGGLAEGFAACRTSGGHRRFRVALSIENDPPAHRTSQLRIFLQRFRELPPAYYEFLNNPEAGEPDWARLHPKRWAAAGEEALDLELGTRAARPTLRRRIEEIREKYVGEPVLLGGPPCQAYSVIPDWRSRRLKIV